MATANEIILASLTGGSVKKEEEEREPLTPEQIKGRGQVISKTFPELKPAVDKATSSSPGFVGRLLGVLDLPRKAIFETLIDPLIPGDQEGFGDLVKDANIPMWLKRGIGFVGDTLTDPLTYVSFGTAGLAKNAGKTAVTKIALNNAAKKSAGKLGITSILKEGDELSDLARLTGRSKADLIENVDELAEAASRVSPAGKDLRLSSRIKALTPEERALLPRHLQPGVRVGLTRKARSSRAPVIQTKGFTSPVSEKLFNNRFYQGIVRKTQYGKHAAEAGWKGDLWRMSQENIPVAMQAKKRVVNDLLNRTKQHFGMDSNDVEHVKKSYEDFIGHLEGTADEVADEVIDEATGQVISRTSKLNKDQRAIIEEWRQFLDDTWGEMAALKPDVGYLFDYFPRIISKEGQAALHGGIGGNVPIRGTWGSQIKTRTGAHLSLPEMNAKIKAETGIDNFFSDNPLESLSKWTERAVSDIAWNKHIHEMIESGIYKNDLKEWVSDAGRIWNDELSRAGFKDFREAQGVARRLMDGEEFGLPGKVDKPGAAELAKWQKLPEHVQEFLRLSSREASHKNVGPLMDAFAQISRRTNHIQRIKATMGKAADAERAAKHGIVEEAQRMRAVRQELPRLREELARVTESFDQEIGAWDEELRLIKEQLGKKPIRGADETRDAYKRRVKKRDNQLKKTKGAIERQMAQRKAVRANRLADLKAKVKVQNERIKALKPLKDHESVAKWRKAQADIRKQELKYEEALMKLSDEEQQLDYLRSGFTRAGEDLPSAAKKGHAKFISSELAEIKDTRFGGLNGKYAPKEIAAEINENLRRVSPSELGKGYDRFLKLFKRWVTVPFPGFHVRNAFGGYFNNYIGGVRNPHYYQAMALFPGVGEKLGVNVDQVAARYGMTREALVQEIDALTNSSMLAEFTDQAAIKKGVKGVLGKLSPVRHGGNLAYSTERVLRGAAFLRGLELTGDVAQARAFTYMRQGNYSDLFGLTASEQQVRRLIPFYKWSRFNIPLQFQHLLEEPGNTVRAVRFVNIFNDEELTEELKEAGLMPDFISKSGGFALNMFGNTDSPLLFKADLPVFDESFQAATAVMQGDVVEGFKTIFNSATPLVKIFSDVATGNDAFSGRNLRKHVPARGILGAVGRAMEAAGLPGTSRTKGGELRIAGPLYSIFNAIPTSRLTRSLQRIIEGDTEGIISDIFGVRPELLDEDAQQFQLSLRRSALSEIESELRSRGYNEELQQTRVDLGLTAEGLPRQE